MASDGEDINITPAESLASATDTEDEELDPPHGNSDFESDDEILERGRLIEIKLYLNSFAIAMIV